MLLRKRLIAIFTSLACMLSVMCVFGQISNYSSQVNKVSALSNLSAEEITSQMTIGWNLGNSLDSYNSSYTIDVSPSKFATTWGNPEPTKELIQTVKNAGFNTIRIPTTWYQHVSVNETNGVYEIDQTWLDYVKQVVDWAYEEDMFVILNLHHEEGIINVSEFTDETLLTASKYINNVWSKLAYTFKDYDQHLIFEGMNEPRQKENSTVSEWGNGSGDNGYSWAYINTLNRQFINTVRNSGSENNKERLLMIPAYVATSDTSALNSLSISTSDGNVAISVHAYAPYFFTMDTSEYANHTFPGKSGYGEDYESNLKSLFTSLKSVSDSKGVPIIIGEFSASDFENTADRVEWAKCYLSNAKEVGIPCVLWDNNVSANGTGEAHGYIYRLTNTIYPNSADVLKAMMDTVGVTNYVLPEYEEYVPPKFSWDNIPIDDNWIEVYKSESGETLKSWDNICLSDWKQYLTEDYKFALVYDSTSEVELVLQASATEGWYRVPSSSGTDFIAYFDYDDMMDILSANGSTIDDIDNLFLSATSGSATMYGLYAISEQGTVGPGGLVTLDGTIIAIDENNNTVTIEVEESGETYTTIVDVTSGRFVCDGSYSVGDAVSVTGYAQSIAMNPEWWFENALFKVKSSEETTTTPIDGPGGLVTLDGTIIAIDENNNTVTIEVEESGKTYTTVVDVTSGRFVCDGSYSVGDAVLVTGYAQSIAMNPEWWFENALFKVKSSEETTTTVTTIETTTNTTIDTTTTTTIDTTTVTTIDTIIIPPDVLLGDVNSDGYVKSNDLLLLKKYLLGLAEESEINYTNSDMNSDGDVKSNDLLALKKVLLGLE